MDQSKEIPVEKTENGYKYRPEVHDPDRIRKLASELNQAPQKLVNHLIKIGCDCIEEYLKIEKENFLKKINKLIK